MSIECAKTIFETHCKGEFDTIKQELKAIRTTLTGNGAEGIMGRLIRQEERTAYLIGWKKWLIGAFTVILTGIIVSFILG